MLPDDTRACRSPLNVRRHRRETCRWMDVLSGGVPIRRQHVVEKPSRHRPGAAPPQLAAVRTNGATQVRVTLTRVADPANPTRQPISSAVLNTVR